MHDQPTLPFRFRALGPLAGLGRRCAVAEVFGLKFLGFLAWWLWRTISLMTLPGLERKLRVAVDWTFDLFFPRDIVFLRPLHTPKGEGVVSESLAGDACPVSQPARNPVTVRQSRVTVHSSRGLP